MKGKIKVDTIHLIGDGGTVAIYNLGRYFFINKENMKELTNDYGLEYMHTEISIDIEDLELSDLGNFFITLSKKLESPPTPKAN